MTSPRVLAAPDKFKGTATAVEVAAAIAAGARAAGCAVTSQPLSDGGEGLLAVAGGPNRWTEVTGPLGGQVRAAWRLDETGAVLEMSEAAGLVLVGGALRNDPVSATTTGVGELIAAAANAGARRIVVGCGGSATTDGGEGALRAIDQERSIGDIDLVAACDVSIGFLEAARLFGPQKGATPADVEVLTVRLRELAGRYEEVYGRDVTTIPGAGAAGGLAGGLAAIGARLVSGFELVAEMTRLDELVAVADVVVTGEGFLDELSFSGKVVGEVARRAAGRPAACVTGGSSLEGRRLAADRGLEVLELGRASERSTDLTGNPAARPAGQSGYPDPSPTITALVEAWLRSL